MSEFSIRPFERTPYTPATTPEYSSFPAPAKPPLVKPAALVKPKEAVRRKVRLPKVVRQFDVRATTNDCVRWLNDAPLTEVEARNLLDASAAHYGAVGCVLYYDANTSTITARHPGFTAELALVERTEN